MNMLLLYLIKASVSLAIFYSFYALVNKREAFFNFNRAFLLTAILFASLLPLIDFNFFNLAGTGTQAAGNIIYYAQLPSVQLNEVIINSGQNPISSFSIFSILTFIYFAVVAVKLLQFLLKLKQISTFSNRYKNIINDGICYVLTTNDLPVFSFFNRIFINEKTFSKPNADKIIEHEKIHIKQYHSIDLLIAEMVAIFQWFNPFAYLLKRAIKENHEFIADQQIVSKQTDSSNYKLLLLEYASFIKTNKLAHNFSYSLLKRRLDMIKKPREPRRIFIGLIGAVLAFSFVIFACSTPAVKEQLTNGIGKGRIALVGTEIGELDVNPEYPGGSDSLFAFLGRNINYPATPLDDTAKAWVIVNFTVNKDGSVGEAEVLKGYSQECNDEVLEAVRRMPDWKPGTRHGEKVNANLKVVVNFSPGQTTESLTQTPVSHSATGDSVFKVVDHMPEFPGGINALMQYLGSNIKYPEQAKRDSIQGRVFVSFVVEKDGAVSSAKVLRGIGGGCDEEAIRVISSMPNWKPGLNENGEAVRVAYNIPIKYALN